MSKEEVDEYTRAMVEDGNVDVIMKKKTNIDLVLSEICPQPLLREGCTSGGCSRCGEVHICVGVL